jgi:hypothetical protein
MVKDENIHFHIVNKFVNDFLKKNNASLDLLEIWRHKQTSNKLKNSLKKPYKPQQPPRPKSEYIYFCEMTRPIIQKEMREKTNSDHVNIHDVTCEMGRRWQLFKKDPIAEIESEIKTLSIKDKERYQKEKENLQTQTKKETKNHFASNYLYFCNQQREQNPKIKMETLGHEWSLLKSKKLEYIAFNEAFEKAKRDNIAKK